MREENFKRESLWFKSKNGLISSFLNFTPSCSTCFVLFCLLLPVGQVVFQRCHSEPIVASLFTVLSPPSPSSPSLSTTSMSPSPSSWPSHISWRWSAIWLLILSSVFLFRIDYFWMSSQNRSYTFTLLHISLHVFTFAIFISITIVLPFWRIHRALETQEAVFSLQWKKSI